MPAHSDLDGNFEADLLATEGSLKEFCGPQPMFGVTNKYRRSLVCRNVNYAHTSRWANLREGSHTRLFVTEPSRMVTRSLLDYSRNKIGLYVNLITGHSLNKHMFRLRIAQSPLCRLCLEEDECPAHILCECPAIISSRLATFGREYIRRQNIHSLKLKMVLHFLEDQLSPG